MMSLSQLPDPNHFASIGWICVILSAIVFALRNAIGFWRDISRPSGADAMAAAKAEFATVKALEELAVNFETYKAEEARQAALRRKGIYDKIDSSRDVLMVKMEADRKELDGKISDVHKRVDNMPDRIITTLRNVGALK